MFCLFPLIFSMIRGAESMAVKFHGNVRGCLETHIFMCNALKLSGFVRTNVRLNIAIPILFSALSKRGRTQMGSDGFNRILTGFYLLDPARVRAVPSKTHDFKGFLRAAKPAEVMRLFCLQLEASCLQWSFLLTVDNFSFFTYSWSFFALLYLQLGASGKVRLIRALRDCKQGSLTVSKKARNVSKKASPHPFLVPKMNWS